MQSRGIDEMGRRDLGVRREATAPRRLRRGLLAGVRGTSFERPWPRRCRRSFLALPPHSKAQSAHSSSFSIHAKLHKRGDAEKNGEFRGGKKQPSAYLSVSLSASAFQKKQTARVIASPRSARRSRAAPRGSGCAGFFRCHRGASSRSSSAACWRCCSCRAGK